jgi:tetratricopeptide (TPR) repeat protein
MREGSTSGRSESDQGVLEFPSPAVADNMLPFVLPAAAASADNSPTEAEDWYDLACELETKSPAEARKAYARALDLDPAHAGARVNLGRLIHEAGHPLAAASHYQQAP